MKVAKRGKYRFGAAPSFKRAEPKFEDPEL